MSKTINPNDYQKLEKENNDLRAKIARLEAERAGDAKPTKTKAAPIEAPAPDDDGA